MNPIKIVDAWCFNGFNFAIDQNTVEIYKDDEKTCGLLVTTNGNHVILKTPSGSEKLEPDDEVLILDVAGCIGRSKEKPTDAIITMFLHELSHWANEKSTAIDHQETWWPFLLKTVKNQSLHRRVIE